MFWIAIPIAMLIDATVSVFVVTELPTANPTISPSGMLCRVIAENNEMSLLFLELIFCDAKFVAIIMAVPMQRPRTIGMRKCFVVSFERLIAGMRSEKIPADNMMPDERYRAYELTLGEKDLKKNINEQPNKVAKNGAVNAIVISMVWFMQKVS